MKKYLFVMLALSTASFAYAGDHMDGNFLYSACNGNTSERAYCLAYIFGVEGGVFTEASLESKSDPWCVPPTVTVEQIKDVVVKFLKDHPEQRHFAAPVLVYSAISNSFPCKK